MTQAVKATMAVETVKEDESYLLSSSQQNTNIYYKKGEYGQ